MSKSILIHTIGTRDLQIPIDVPINQETRDLLGENDEDGRFYVINKRSDRGQTTTTFRDRCQKLLDLYTQKPDSEVVQKTCFPIVEPAIQYIKSTQFALDKLVLVPTFQTVPYIFDTDILGKIIKQVFLKRIQAQYAIIDVEVSDLDISAYRRNDEFSLIGSVRDKMDNILQDQYEHVFISHKAGHPSVMNALIFYGCFKNYTYLSTSPDDCKAVDYSELENLLRKNLESSQ